VPDTARRLRRHEQTVRAMIRRGDLAAVRLGRLIRVLAAGVEGGLPVSLSADAGAAPLAAPRRTVRRLVARVRA
jgi:excisionase family DNA binding protein